MCYYRFACALLMVVASSVSCDNRQPPSTISLHQSASASDESFTPLSGYDDDDGGGGGGRGGGGRVDGGSLFPADVAGVRQVFAPTLPIAEKQVLELAGLRAVDGATTSSSGRGSSQRSQAQADDEHHPAAQKIYPTFFRNIPPLGHSRPYYQSTEAAIEQRFNKLRAPALPEVAASPLLGSGDFGVIKGGTFYYDTDAPTKGFADDFYGLGYSGNNGHGRPQLAFLVQKPPHQKEEQFSNFRDFADINISNDPAYSHHAPLYATLPPVPADSNAGTGGTSDASVRHEPDNILDELRSLDRESATATTTRTAQGKGRGKAKKSSVIERKKRPKSAKDGAKEAQLSADPADDYMLASS